MTRRVPVYVNVYDMMPSNALTSMGYLVGIGIYHTGVEVLGKEFNFGGHEWDFTGVFSVDARVGPPGVVYKQTIVGGFTTLSDDEINQTIHDLSKEYAGNTYTLLTRNCNHFTADLVYALTGKRVPAWINRAAKLGTMIPCIVPPGWIDSPSVDAEELTNDPNMHLIAPSTSAVSASRPSAAYT